MPDYSILEVVAIVFGFVSVWFNKQENILVYPTGLVWIVIYIFITYEAGLYADMGINFYYMAVSIYGWINWSQMKRSTPQHVTITKNSVSQNLTSIGTFLLGFFVLRFILTKTDSDVPTWDAITTSSSIVAMWLMSKKKIENWMAWFVTNTISIPLYYVKGLPFTSFQYVVFTALTISGYISWRKKINDSQEE